MPDIKKFIQDLKDNGSNVNENDLVGSLSSYDSASKFYENNEKELGVDKDYFMSMTYTPSSADIEYENSVRNLNNLKKRNYTIRKQLESDVTNNIISPDSLFKENEDIDKKIKEQENIVRSARNSRKNYSKSYNDLLTPRNKGENVILSSGILDELNNNHEGDIKSLINEKLDKIQQHLVDPKEQVLYATKYQMQYHQDNLENIKSIVDNFKNKNRSPNEEIQYQMALNALENANNSYESIKSSYDEKYKALNEDADRLEKEAKDEKEAELNALLPEGIHDTDLVNKMIDSDPKLKKRIKLLDEKIVYAKSKKGDFFKDNSGGKSQYDPLLDRINVLLNNVAGDSKTKIQAYAIAKQMFLEKLEKEIEDDQQVNIKKSAGLISVDDNLEKKIKLRDDTERELQNLAPIALLNISPTNDSLRYSDSILKSLMQSAKDYGISFSKGLLNTDFGHQSIAVKSKYVSDALDNLDLKQEVRPDIFENMFGSQIDVDKLQKENEDLKKNNLTIVNDGKSTSEVWKTDEAKTQYEDNLKRIQNAYGEINTTKGEYIEMFGGSMRIAGDILLADLMISSGIGAAGGIAELGLGAEKTAKLYNLLSKSKLVKGTLSALKDSGEFENAAANYSRGTYFLSNSLADGIKWEFAANVLDQDRADDDQLHFGEGFLGKSGEQLVEALVPNKLKGFIKGKTRGAIQSYLVRNLGQLPAEYIQENFENTASQIKESTGRDIFTGMVDIIANGMEDSEQWKKYKEDFKKIYGYSAQKDLLMATSALTMMFSSGAGIAAAAKTIFQDNGGDLKMMEDMKHYFSDVKSIQYGGQYYHYDGEKWVDRDRKEASQEVKDKLSVLSPSPKQNDKKYIGKNAKFDGEKWVDSEGNDIQAKDLENIILGFKQLETSTNPKVTIVQNDSDFATEDGANDESPIISEKQKEFEIQNGNEIAEAKQGNVMYTKNGNTFTFDKKEGSKKATFNENANLRKLDDGSYYIVEKTNIKDSIEITGQSQFALSKAIKNADNTKQRRALKSIRAMIPLTRGIKKIVNGENQSLKIKLHSDESYNKINPGNRGHYDPNEHTIHMNLGAIISNSPAHEIMHPFMTALFDHSPELKEKFFNELSDEYKRSYPDKEEAIVEYSADSLVYKILPKIDKDPNFFIKVYDGIKNFISDYFGWENDINSLIDPSISLDQLIGNISGVIYKGNNENIFTRKIKQLKSEQKKSNIPNSDSFKKRAMSILNIPEFDSNGKRYSNEDLSRMVEEAYNNMQEDISEFDFYDHNEFENQMFISNMDDNLREWKDFIDNSNYPIEFKALMLAEVMKYNYDGEYKNRGFLPAEKLNKYSVDKIYNSGKKEGFLKQMYDLNKKDIESSNIESNILDQEEKYNNDISELEKEFENKVENSLDGQKLKIKTISNKTIVENSKNPRDIDKKQKSISNKLTILNKLINCK